MRKLNKKPRKKNMSTQEEGHAEHEAERDAGDVARRRLGVRDDRHELHGHGREDDARREVLHRRDEEHGRLGDAHGEAEDDHRDARPADEAHGVADDMLRGLGYFLEVHGVKEL